MMRVCNSTSAFLNQKPDDETSSDSRIPQNPNRALRKSALGAHSSSVAHIRASLLALQDHAPKACDDVALAQQIAPQHPRPPASG